ncbi:aminopeptidase YwaD precursor [Clostridium homopropionicum DSM 5847]|uniref:Aminopeptidase YwaD n=1 Tax=Clostridium homopropionicum DSM 5847 TaxID=1121318 RepID=A0A0L6Z5U3_9CLOT|nr:M28 family metallopeptidase [Clostridium homopropionicum]KOA18335.1 aminopeptidase YwaD precursor [Clostridium homopropionicum DSM 5847]SFF68994.1 Peptidase family M28 [Clostridium homopropionicum]
MKRLIIQFISCISFLIISTCIQFYYNVVPFNTLNVINKINFISSDNFKGRLTGTLENKEVEEYIKLQFIENNLKPFMGEYTQSFKVNYPHKISGEPHLKILDKNGDIIKSFTYNKDYKEDMLNFRSNSIKFKKDNPSVKVSDKLIQVQNSSDLFLFYISSKDNLSFRSSFSSNSNFSMCIILTSDTLNEIKEYLNKDYTIDCFIPIISKETTVNNIMGYIEGKNPTLDPLILSAHFDHLGSDLKNNVYRGALDNASGTAFLLELAGYVSSIGKPERSILFIGFNAEEFGCLGSEEFVKKYKKNIQNSKVMNFDMIGSDKGVPLCIVGGKKDTAKTSFINSISATCANEKIHFNYLFEDASDHKSFRENNIDAVTFCDNDMSRIHTMSDTPELISTSAIERCFKIVSKEIITYSFNNNLLIIYYKEAALACSLLIIISLITSLKNKS